MPLTGSATRQVLVAETILRDGGTPIYEELTAAWRAEGRCLPGRPDSLWELLPAGPGAAPPTGPTAIPTTVPTAGATAVPAAAAAAGSPTVPAVAPAVVPAPVPAARRGDPPPPP
ncbi:hypothetical protein ACFW1A_01735 [Kitasatospora sp. NPDC058965]|uniref:hypothetical protein n=1 Tax=Kitasatospora sp. NPDC058965 TaxID=3346682 RepID=UPI00369F6D1F